MFTIRKPKISHENITPEAQAQFDLFFSDKANVSMSSYKVDSKTNLPILYLQDDKQALWKKFSETYPNGSVGIWPLAVWPIWPKKSLVTAKCQSIPNKY